MLLAHSSRICDRSLPKMVISGQYTQNALFLSIRPGLSLPKGDHYRKAIITERRSLPKGARYSQGIAIGRRALNQKNEQIFSMRRLPPVGRSHKGM